MVTGGAARVMPLRPIDAIVEKQLGAVKAVGRKNYEAGIMTPRADPIEAAIASKEKWWNNVSMAHDENRFENGLRGVTMAEWYAYSIDIGAPRYMEGVVKREAKINKFWRGWHPLLGTHVDTVRSLPDVTSDDRERRMIENRRGLMALHGQWKT